MSSGITDDGAEMFLAALLDITPIVNVWVAMLTDQPGVGMDGTILAQLEPQDPDYGRIEYGWGATHWGQAGRFATNLDTVVFALPSVDWGLINHFALLNAETDGKIYAFGELSNPNLVQAGWDAMLPIGGMILSLNRQDASIQV